jgi:hypothetical protein
MHSQLSSYLEGWIKTLAGHKDSSNDDEYSIDSDEGSIDNDEDPSDEDSSDRIQSDSDEDSSDGSLAFWVPPSFCVVRRLFLALTQPGWIANLCMAQLGRSVILLA